MEGIGSSGSYEARSGGYGSQSNGSASSYSGPTVSRSSASLSKAAFGAFIETAKVGMKSMVSDPLASRHSSSGIGNGSSSGNGRHHQGRSGGYSGGYKGNNGWNNGRNDNSFNPPGRDAVRERTGGEWGMATNVGAGAGQAWSSSVASAAAPTSVVSDVKTGEAVADGQYEKSLIDRVCSPEGMGITPPASYLRELLDEISGLDMDLICELLLDNLTSQSKEVRGKSWYVIDALKDQSHCASFFQECKQEISSRRDEEKTARVKIIADKVCNNLDGGESQGGEDGSSEKKGAGKERSSQAKSGGEQEVVCNLLDFGDQDQTPASSQVHDHFNSGESGNQAVQLSEAPARPPMAPPPPVPPSDSLSISPCTSKEDAPSAAPPNAPSSGGGGLFGGLSMKVTDGPSISSTATATSQGPAAIPVAVDLTGTSFSANPLQASDDLLSTGSLTDGGITQETVASGSAASNATSSQGELSAFDLLSGGNSSSQAPPAAPAAAPAPAPAPAPVPSMGQMMPPIDQIAPVAARTSGVPDILPTPNPTSTNSVQDTFDPLVSNGGDTKDGGLLAQLNVGGIQGQVGTATTASPPQLQNSNAAGMSQVQNMMSQMMSGVPHASQAQQAALNQMAAAMQQQQHQLAMQQQSQLLAMQAQMRSMQMQQANSSNCVPPSNPANSKLESSGSTDNSEGFVFIKNEANRDHFDFVGDVMKNK